MNRKKSVNKYITNTSWLFFERILRMTIGLFIGVMVARYLGPEQFGLYSYVGSFVGLFTTIATVGLDGILVRELIKEPDRRDTLIGTAFVLKLIGALVVLSLLAIAVNFTSNDLEINILVFIVASAVIFQSFNVIDFYFQSQVLSKYVAYTNIISLFISSIVKIILILNDAPLIAFTWVIVFDGVTLAAGYIYFYYKKELSVRRWKYDHCTAINLLKDSWSLIISGVIITIYMKIDQIMLKEMSGIEAVGHYAAAVRLSEAWYFIPGAIIASIFPAIVNAKKQSEELYHSRLQQLYDVMVWLAIVIALPMTFMSNWIISLLYGTQFVEAGSVLMIHIWSSIFVFLGIAFGKYLLIENLGVKSLQRALLGSFINIILNYILIPIYGGIGAAIATLIGQISANLIFDIFDKKMHFQLVMKLKSFFPIHYLKSKGS